MPAGTQRSSSCSTLKVARRNPVEVRDSPTVGLLLREAHFGTGRRSEVRISRVGPHAQGATAVILGGGGLVCLDNRQVPWRVPSSRDFPGRTSGHKKNR